MTDESTQPPRLKICQVTAVDFTVEHFLAPLIEALQVAGHDVSICCADTGFSEQLRQGSAAYFDVPFDRSMNPIRHFHAFRQISRIFKSEEFDLVHVHTPIASVVARLAAARTRVPVVVYTAHGFYFHENTKWLTRGFAIAIEWIAGRWTDALFTQSSEDAETARRLRLCRSGNVTAIGNGVDPSDFSAAHAPTDMAHERIRLGLEPDGVVIVVVGRLVVEKGYLDLLSAVADFSAVQVWVVGERLQSDHSGQVESAFDDYVQAQGGADLVRLGYRSDVSEILRCADIFCLPSHREGMPRSIIEAMMSGLAVVGTDIRGTREEVVNGETGLLVPPNDSVALRAALLTLVEDSEMRDRMGRAGRRRALDLYDESVVIELQMDVLGL